MLDTSQLKAFLRLVNQVYEIEQGITKITGTERIARNITKMKDALLEFGFFYEDPQGQSYKETRTDLEATIAGSGTANLIVVEVHKPIVRFGVEASSRIVQKGIVVVASKEESSS
jgi:hypothetical protein